MHKTQYAMLNESLGAVHNSIMRKEMGDDGWDLRDELLALKEVVSELAMLVYQDAIPGDDGNSRAVIFLEAHERAEDEFSSGKIDKAEFLEQIRLIRVRYRAPQATERLAQAIQDKPVSACCGKPLRREFVGRETTIYFCSQCGKQQ
jgi:hypothetical protein